MKRDVSTMRMPCCASRPVHFLLSWVPDCDLDTDNTTLDFEPYVSSCKAYFSSLPTGILHSYQLEYYTAATKQLRITIVAHQQASCYHAIPANNGSHSTPIAVAIFSSTTLASHTLRRAQPVGTGDRGGAAKYG